jgi:ASC-1-like (ASCH) protein
MTDIRTSNAITEISVAAPWYGHLRAGRKCVEGRLAKGKFASLRVGSMLHIKPSSAASGAHQEGFVATVARVTRYASFEAYLSQEGLRNTLPGVSTVAGGVAIYRQFYSAVAEKENGVLAIQVVRIP